MNTSPGTSGPAPIALRRDEGEALWFLDFLATIKSSADTTGGRVAVIEHLAGQDAGSPLHVHHREDEWFYVLDGELTIWVDGQVIPAPAGSFVYGPRNTPHTFTVSSPEGARFLLVTEPAGFEGFMRAVAEPARALTLPPPPSDTSQAPDPAQLAALAAEYGIDILGPQASQAESRTSQPGKVRDGAPPAPTRATVTTAARQHRLTTHRRRLPGLTQLPIYSPGTQPGVTGANTGPCSPASVFSHDGRHRRRLPPPQPRRHPDPGHPRTQPSMTETDITPLCRNPETCPRDPRSAWQDRRGNVSRQLTLSRSSSDA